MKYRMLVSVAIVLVGAATGQGGTIFSNFEAGDSFPMAKQIGLVTSPIGPPFIVERSAAFQVPSGPDYSLDTIGVFVNIHSGPNELDILLMADSGGVPGAIIESFNLPGLMAPLPGSELTVNSVVRPVLAGGSQYWVTLSAPDPSTSALWRENVRGDTGPTAESIDGGPWSASISTRPTLRIEGLVPAPSTVVGLLSMGFLGLLTYGWRRRKAR